MPTTQQYKDTTRRRKLEIALCSKCKSERPWKEFDVDLTRRPFGLSSCCKDCNRERKLKQRNEWRTKQTPDFLKAHDRKRNLKKFGITPDQYDEMFEKQNGLCLICQREENHNHPSTGTLRSLAVDHCHLTGKVRGLLCSGCNKGLGNFKEDLASLKNAIKYLEDNK